MRVRNCGFETQRDAFSFSLCHLPQQISSQSDPHTVLKRSCFSRSWVSSRWSWQQLNTKSHQQSPLSSRNRHVLWAIQSCWRICCKSHSRHRWVGGPKLFLFRLLPLRHLPSQYQWRIATTLQLPLQTPSSEIASILTLSRPFSPKFDLCSLTPSFLQELSIFVCPFGMEIVSNPIVWRFDSSCLLKRVVRRNWWWLNSLQTCHL